MQRSVNVILVCGLFFGLACSSESTPPADEGEQADTMEAAAPEPAPAEASALPTDIADVIRTEFTESTHYLDGSVDLNGDGQAEIVVHAVGPMACGTGGCPTLVFTPSETGYRVVSTISVSRPPIRASATRTSGWRNLIVHIGGGGGESGDRELAFDGESYPGNPTVAGPRVTPATLEGAETIIEEFGSFEDTKALP
jgi:hypothetical protein